MVIYSQEERTEGKDAATWLNEGLADLVKMSELPCTKDNVLRFIIAGVAYLTQIRIVTGDLTETQLDYYQTQFTRIKNQYREKISGEDK